MSLYAFKLNEYEYIEDLLQRKWKFGWYRAEQLD